MKKQSIAFTVGIISGAGAVILYLAAAGKLWTSAPVPSSAQTAEAHTYRTESVAVEPAPSNPVAASVTPSEAGSPATTAQTGKASDSLGTPPVPIQYLPPALQQVLQQYQKTDDPDARKSLLTDVVSMADDDTSKREAVQVLDQMFQEENSTDLKLEILEDLVLIDHPSSIVPFVDAIDPSQPSEVRVSAAEDLGSLGDRRAIPFLEQFLSDPNPDLQQAAKDALDELRPE